MTVRCVLLQVPINSTLVYSSPINHHVQLENLLPNQTYTYSVGDGGGNTTQALEFTTTGLQPPTSTVRCEQQQAQPLRPPCRVEPRMLLFSRGRPGVQTCWPAATQQHCHLQAGAGSFTAGELAGFSCAWCLHRAVLMLS